MLVLQKSCNNFATGLLLTLIHDLLLYHDNDPLILFLFCEICLDFDITMLHTSEFMPGFICKSNFHSHIITEKRKASSYNHAAMFYTWGGTLWITSSALVPQPFFFPSHSFLSRLTSILPVKLNPLRTGLFVHPCCILDRLYIFFTFFFFEIFLGWPRFSLTSPAKFIVASVFLLLGNLAATHSRCTQINSWPFISSLVLELMI